MKEYIPKYSEVFNWSLTEHKKQQLNKDFNKLD
jgi:hypothetical protein